jgi:hypothetical protein
MYPTPDANPLATTEQRDGEALAMRVLASEPVGRARELVAMRWKTLAGRPAPQEAWGARFDELIEEFAFAYCLKAVAGDPNHPIVLGMHYCPPHEWFGTRVPGSRGSGGDGPDQHYVLIPVVYGAHYEIYGQRFDPVPADIPLTVIGNPSITMTLGSLDLLDIKVDDDGRYRLTVGPEPSNGDPNHVHVPPGAMYLFNRECRSDWRQVPSHWTVRRLDPPAAEPWTEEQVAVRAASMMIEDVAPMHWFLSIFAAMEANSVSPLFNTGTVGGLVSQSIMFARLQVDARHAFVFTIGPGDAPYRNIVLHDYWFRTIDYWERQSSLNNGQSAPNPDGSITYVVAHEDPGVANWLDPCGFEHLLVVNRWQGLRGGLEPSAAGRLVALAELEAVLPEHIPRVTPAERAAQLAGRRSSFLLRFQDDGDPSARERIR